MRRNGKKESGLTLIELLVVGTIIMILTVVSLPIVKPLLDSQLTKSGANIVSTFLSRAKNQAMLTGRPCGVLFEVWDGTNELIRNQSGNPVALPLANGQALYYVSRGASLVLRQVEVPPVYSGMFDNETVDITPDINGQEAKVVYNPSDTYLTQRLASETEAKMQIGSSGPYYPFTGNKLSGGTTAELYPIPKVENVPFKIMFSPKTTMTAPETLPQGVTVDLSFSGVGDGCFGPYTCQSNSFQSNGAAPLQDVMILFAPDGSVITADGTQPTQPIHFLIGRWDQITAVRSAMDMESLPNYADGRNFWVTINPQNGNIAVNQVNPVTDIEDLTVTGTHLGRYPISTDLDQNGNPILSQKMKESRALTHP